MLWLEPLKEDVAYTSNSRSTSVELQILLRSSNQTASHPMVILHLLLYLATFFLALTFASSINNSMPHRLSLSGITFVSFLK